MHPRLSTAALLRSLAWLPALLVLAPLLYVAWRGLASGEDIWPHIAANRLPGYLWQSAALTLAVTLLAILFGVPCAWLVAVYEFPGRKRLEWALLLPLAMPGFVAALAYVDALERLIPFYAWIRQHHGIEAFLLSQRLAPWVFAVIVLGSTIFPYVYLSCRAVFARESAGQLEAARLLGAGPFRAFFSIALPMARPAVAAGASLVAMEAANDFGVVSAFGLSTLTPGIYRVWGEGHAGAAMRLALILMALVLLFVGLERWQRGRRQFAADPADLPLTRRRLRWPGVLLSWAVCLLPLTLGFFLPGWRMARWAWQSWPKIQWSGHASAAANTLFLASAAGLAVVAAAALITGARRAVSGASLAWAQRLGLSGYAMPSALVAVGAGALLSRLATVPGLAWVALSASVCGLLLAYGVRFLAVGLQPLAAASETVSGSLHEASRALGSGPLSSLWRVDFPLLRPAMIAGFTLAFIDVFKELTITQVLRPFDFETLATLTYRLTGESRIPEASVPGLFMVLVCLAGLIPLTRLLRRSA